MVGLVILFLAMGAYFLGGVHLAVYAGAVTVLFVMVLMLFDLKKNANPIAKGLVSRFLKVSSIGIFVGLITGAVSLTKYYGAPSTELDPSSMASTKLLAMG